MTEEYCAGVVFAETSVLSGDTELLKGSSGTRYDELVTRYNAFLQLAI